MPKAFTEKRKLDGRLIALIAPPSEDDLSAMNRPGESLASIDRKQSCAGNITCVIPLQLSQRQKIFSRTFSRKFSSLLILGVLPPYTTSPTRVIAPRGLRRDLHGLALYDEHIFT